MTPLRASLVYLVVLLTTQSTGVIMVDGIIDAKVGEVTRQIDFFWFYVIFSILIL